MRRLIYFAVAIWTLLQATPLGAMSKERRAFLVDSLSAVLSHKTTTADSIPILYDLFDLAGAKDKVDVGQELLRTALRTSDRETQYDVMRRLSSAIATYQSGQSNKIQDLIELAEKKPQTTDRDNTLTYMRVQKVMNEFTSDADSTQQRKVHEAIRERANGADDQYKKVVVLFTICRYMVSNSPGDMVIDYLGQLFRQIRALPERSYALENTFLVQASVIYTRAGLQDEAVKICKELLRVTQDLDRSNEKKGYKYRDYSRIYFNTYRRLLNNFEALTPEEVEEYYQKIMQLCDEYPEIREQVEFNGRAKIYYAMATKQYGRALELLKQYIDLPQNEGSAASLNRFMLKAAQEVGDKSAELKAATKLNELLGNAIDQHRVERKREIEIFNEMLQLQNERALAAQEVAEMHSQHHTNVVRYSSIAVGLMALVVIVIFIFYRRIRKMSVKLAKSNDELREERDNLQQAQRDLIRARDHARKADRHKTEFINNMSHEVRVPLDTLTECTHLIVDNVDESKRKYLERYGKIADVCADMISTLINDVLLLAEYDNSGIEINKKPESVNTICELAVMSMRKHCKEGVTMTFVQPEGDDVTMATDARRVEQVLVNLLSNGAKFTDKGSVELTYFLAPEEGTITFAVSDTGCGIPKGKEEVIFERFEKLSSMSPGTGLGLNICRIVADAMGGTVKVDTTYGDIGARFLFTLPFSD